MQEQNTPQLIDWCIKQIKIAVAAAVILNDQKRGKKRLLLYSSWSLTIWVFPAFLIIIGLSGMEKPSVMLKLSPASHRVSRYLAGAAIERSQVQVL